MKNIAVFLFCISFYSLINAQQLEVISTGGGYSENGQGSISFSIGEVIIQTIAHGDLCLTQGFCQTNITITAISEIKGLDYELMAYPNPTKNYVILKIGIENLRKLKFILYDANGRLILMKEIISDETQIPFNFLIPANYYLKIFDELKELKTFKIVKTN
ncbi:MAG: T9SS type A sorting domain-containing protein [Bacteroidetes bacterium]|nr:T9SS type A sorting domain-containing protein [Bacteroidota bacterium]